MEQLRKIAPRGTRLEQITDGYEALHEWRNHLVHGAHYYANGTLWTWREPTSAKGNAAFSYQFNLASLQQTAQAWQNLADAAQDALDQKTDSASASQSERE
ncbi:hypothetical protein B1790_28960 [Mycobacterium sp. AT1]|nr:hypothetical protein B1790_28960 [Mycobacterium sp. AT1]